MTRRLLRSERAPCDAGWLRSTLSTLLHLERMLADDVHLEQIGSALWFTGRLLSGVIIE
jgi:hypothetical protein